MNATTQRLGPDDWPQWRSVRLEALAESPAAFRSRLADWIDATEDRWTARLRDVPLNVIARRDEAPVGQVSAMSTDRATTIELISMWVSPTARGTGVGDALIEAVTSWATSRQAGTVELSVRELNIPARRLYERNGFTTSGAGDSDDEIRMARTLR